MEKEPTTEVTKLTDEKIEELKRDPQNTFYDVKYDTPARILPVAEVKQVLGVIRNLYTTLRADHPAWDDDKIRDQIKEKSLAAKRMSTKVNGEPATHPRLFLLVTSHDSTEEDFQTLNYMLHLREMEEKGDLKEEESRAHLFQHLSNIKPSEE